VGRQDHDGVAPDLRRDQPPGCANPLEDGSVRDGKRQDLVRVLAGGRHRPVLSEARGEPCSADRNRRGDRAAAKNAAITVLLQTSFVTLPAPTLAASALADSPTRPGCPTPPNLIVGHREGLEPPCS
jgi:hypothetical protein